MNNNNVDYLQSELTRMDLLIHRQILRMRASYQLSLDEFRGLYISDQQVDDLINQFSKERGTNPGVDELTEKAESLRNSNWEKYCGDIPFLKVVKEFNLSVFEQDVLLLALAPEIDLKYQTMYAYLNNDVTRKYPTRDLALKLFSSDVTQRMSMRGFLLPEANLFTSGLLQPATSSPVHPSWLSGGFSLSTTVSHHLQGFLSHDPYLYPFIKHKAPKADWSDVPLPTELCATLRRSINLLRHPSPEKPLPYIIFEGRYGTGRFMAAEAMCQNMGLSLLRVDMEAVRASSEPLTRVIQGLALQQRLRRTGVYVDHGEAFFDKEGNLLPEAVSAIKKLRNINGTVFIACVPGIRWRELMKGQRCLSFYFGDPDYTDRLKLWIKCMEQEGNNVPHTILENLADRFVLTPGQIRDTVSSAVDACQLNNGSEGALSNEALFDAARTQSDQSLGRLTMKVKTIHTWDDLILPNGTMKRVREVTAAIKYRHVVYSEWGFENRITSGKGLKVLFNGASGTGKTMTAGVIARDLGLELYKIDLSSVVSKYIGETEKNLNHIFRAAHSSNAILFFDEADALFGKRSEVKDAHDRYANIEISYLLQKMEEHEGAVILASNLGNNIDDAFSRRMHYIVDFPLPGDRNREQLWRGMFPARAPMANDVNLQFMAKQFDIAGGDIRNVVLNAAFMAAQNGREITMSLLVRSMARQMVKQGRVPSPTDFKGYYSLISDGK